MNLLQKLEHYIENEPWEEYIEDSQKWLDWFSWGAIVAAILWFGGVILIMYLDGKL
jgi:hypothetical protein